MPDFIPVLIVAVLSFIVLLLAFSGEFGISGPGSVSQSSRTISMGSDFSISFQTGNESVASFGGQVDSGLFSNVEEKKEFSIPNVGDATEGLINMRVWNSNYYGDLIVNINGNNVYRGAPLIGQKTVSFNSSLLKSENEIDVMAENSGWKMWAPTVYILDTSVSVDYESKTTQAFKFDMTSSENSSLSRARLLIFGNRTGTGDLIVKLNGNTIYEGRTPVYTDFAIDKFNVGTNTVEINTEPGTEYHIDSAQIVLFYG